MSGDDINRCHAQAIVSGNLLQCARDVHTSMYHHIYRLEGVEVPSAEPTTLADQLGQWWRDRAESEIGQTVAKATEYSGTVGGLPLDLVNQGREWVFASNRDLADYTDAQLAEIGIWSYMIGKLGRWSSALRNGRMVSDDTLLDLGVYTRIAQRIREKGRWP